MLVIFNERTVSTFESIFNKADTFCSSIVKSHSNSLHTYLQSSIIRALYIYERIIATCNKSIAIFIELLKCVHHLLIFVGGNHELVSDHSLIGIVVDAFLTYKKVRYS